MTQTPPPAPGVSAGSSNTSAALSGKRSPLHLPNGRVGARDGQRTRMATVTPVTRPLGFSFASRCSFQIWGLTCTFLLSAWFCLVYAIPISHQLAQLQVRRVSWNGLYCCRRDNRTPRGLDDAFWSQQYDNNLLEGNCFSAV